MCLDICVGGLTFVSRTLPAGVFFDTQEHRASWRTALTIRGKVMPIYEYVCQDCGKEFEELVFSHDEVPACPACKSGATEKLISACRTRMGGGSPDIESESSASSSASSAPSGCAGCVGGNCSSCG